MTPRMRGRAEGVKPKVTNRRLRKAQPWLVAGSYERSQLVDAVNYRKRRERLRTKGIAGGLAR